MARTKQTPAKDGVAKASASASPVKSMDVGESGGSPRRSVKEMRNLDPKNSTKGSRRVCELRAFKCLGNVQVWFLGVPSKDTIEGYSKGFLDAVNSADQDFVDHNLIFVGELRAQGGGDIPLKNHRGYWWRVAVRLLDEEEKDEDTRMSLCKVAEVSPLTKKMHLVFHLYPY
jgi:hypothetical protein